VIVAAGAGRRLGGAAKALLPAVGGDSFLGAIVAVMRALEVERVIVVVGPPFGDEVARQATGLRAEVVVNPAPERGMASSVALGFERAIALDAGDVALLWPVDHARVATATVRAVLGRATPVGIVIPCCEGRGGHPTAFGRALWPELARCATLEHGARAVVRADPARVDRFDVDDRGVTADVDRPGDP
jgi:CTP:molybdopterin cytidylyltransferase MocA